MSGDNSSPRGRSVENQAVRAESLSKKRTVTWERVFWERQYIWGDILASPTPLGGHKLKLEGHPECHPLPLLPDSISNIPVRTYSEAPPDYKRVDRIEAPDVNGPMIGFSVDFRVFVRPIEITQPAETGEH